MQGYAVYPCLERSCLPIGLSVLFLTAVTKEVQATAIARHVNYVIGMNKAIGDRAAIEFAVGFYDALGAGRPVEFAHKSGCAVIRLAGIPEHLTPVLKKNPSIDDPIATLRQPEDQPVRGCLRSSKVDSIATK
jgi:hypothetical protein